MNLDQTLSLLAQHPSAALDGAEIALHLAREEYGALDVDGYLGELDAMAHELRPQLRGDLSTQVRVLSRYLFHELGFRGNTSNYYDPRNSYFNQVLDRRTGIPITLSLVAMTVAGRAGLSVVGVGLPGHFIAKAVAGGREVLFDPFNEGRVLSPEDCEVLVEKVTGLPFVASPQTLDSTPLLFIVVRMLSNLKGIYLGTRDFRRAVRIIERLRQLLPEDLLQQRDLGAALLHAGQPGRGLEFLSEYLKAVPGAEDKEAVGQLLQQAQREVARWN